MSSSERPTPTPPFRTLASARVGAPVRLTGTLEARLAPLSRDLASTAEELVVEASTLLLDWVEERGLEWSWDQAEQDLRRGLSALLDRHGWRAPVSHWHAALRALLGGAADRGGFDPGVTPRAALAAELGLWLASREEGDAELFGGPWNGVPLAPGRRLPSREAAALQAGGDAQDPGGFGLGPRETILVFGYSETVALALEAASRAGLRPRVLAALAGPLADGPRLARRLDGTGLRVTLTYDAALVQRISEGDRLWLGTEAFDGEGFLGRVGATLVCDAAEVAEVPVELIATSDKFLRGKRAAPPAWCERESRLVWDELPADVEVDSQAWERTPLALVRHLITERGRTSPALVQELAELPTPPSTPLASVAISTARATSRPGSTPEALVSNRLPHD